MKKTTMNVIVHKANIPMVNGESIGQFTTALSKACREHVMSKLNIAKGEGNVYVLEAFGDKAVVEAYKYDDNGDKYKFYAFKYTRTDAGAFEFGDMTEMAKTVSYEPKKTIPGWQPQKKSLWSGLV